MSSNPQVGVFDPPVVVLVGDDVGPLVGVHGLPILVTESDKHAVVIVIGEVGACALRMPQSGAGVGHLSGQEWVRPEEALTARPNSSSLRWIGCNRREPDVPADFHGTYETS
jgi:hypothetical protein